MNKLILAAAALMLAPVIAHADCTAADFKVASFQVQTGDVSNPVMRMPGTLVNDCAQPAAAQILIEAKSDNGSVVQQRKFWPGGTANIGPGKSVKFDAGSMFHFVPNMKTYSVAIVSVRTW